MCIQAAHISSKADQAFISTQQIKNWRNYWVSCSLTMGSNDLLRAQRMLHSAESANQMRRHFRKQRPPCKKILGRGWQEYNVVHRQSPIHHHTHIQSRSGSSYATVTSKSFYSSTWGQACHVEVVSSAFIVKPYLWSCMKYKRLRQSIVSAVRHLSTNECRPEPWLYEKLFGRVKVL